MAGRAVVAGGGASNRKQNLKLIKQNLRLSNRDTYIVHIERINGFVANLLILYSLEDTRREVAILK